MVITPGMITGGMSLLGSLFGNKMSPAQRAQLQILMLQKQLMARAGAAAANYDPAQETEMALGYAKKQAGHTLENAMKSLNQQFKVEGGSPKGDTNFSFRQQRTQDDVLSPLYQFAANRKANEFALKLNALTQAAGTGSNTVAGLQGLDNSMAAGDAAQQSGLSAIIQQIMNQQRSGGSGKIDMSPDTVNRLVRNKKTGYSAY